jgi:hypothetical protein
MGKPVQLPDPTYEAAQDEADERDISMGAVVESWRRDARGEIETGGESDER